MQYAKMLFLAIAMIGFLAACGTKSHSHEGHEHDGTHTETVEKTGKEYTSAYICPMHCEGSGSDKPGTCPACGMDYVKNEEHEGDGHDHTH